jgi:hypothetical protein
MTGLKPRELERVWTYREACERVSFWAGQLVTMGMAGVWGAHYERVRIAGLQDPAYRIMISPHDPG